MTPCRIGTRLLPRLFALCCVFAAGAAQAAWYQVEVVVFEALSPDADGEILAGDPGVPDRAGAVELVVPAAEVAPAAGGGLIPYLALDPSWYRLDGVFRTLRTTKEYRPVFHVAWQQPGEGPGSEQAVHLVQWRDPAAAAAVAAAAATATGTDPALVAAPDALIDGTVQLRVGRFLHVAVDLAYFPTGPSAIPAGAAAGSMRLRTRRKVLLNDLNYFDHPLFGVLVQVSRLQEKPERQ